MAGADIGTAEPVDAALLARMQQSGSYKSGCPVAAEDLRLLKVPFLNSSGKTEVGLMVVHRKVAAEVLQIFAELRRARYPIQRMRLIDDYMASDDASAADNNTSAFNCRPITGMSSGFSKHSYGTAIDVNPLINPYIRIQDAAAKEFTSHLPASAGDSQLPMLLSAFCMQDRSKCTFVPPEGAAYAARAAKAPGEIVRGSKAHEAFRRRGWMWGGNWPVNRADRLRTDFQHFEKM